jgi:hypothetical protein
MGIQLNKNARIVMQVHYYTQVSTEPDQTEIGIYFAKKPVERRLVFLPLVQTRLEIPAGAPNHTVNYNLNIPLLSSKVVNIFPHMHLIGREIKVDAVMPGNRTVPLMYINNWDFNWQGPYTYKEPIAAPGFTNFRMTCTYDNSANNPRNPSNPPKVVRWGEGTEDEMCVAFMGVTFDADRVQQ